MVALAARNPHFRQLPPADFDPGEPLQRAFNPTERKTFVHVKAGVIQHPQGRRIREYLLIDILYDNTGVQQGLWDSALKRLDLGSALGVEHSRMTAAARDALGSVRNGIVIYNTDTDKLQVRAAGAWVDLH